MMTKQHYANYTECDPGAPHAGTYISPAAVVLYASRVAKGHDTYARPVPRKRFGNVLEVFLAKVRAARFRQFDVLESRLARGDQGQEFLDFIDTAIEMIGGAEAFHELLAESLAEAQRKFPG
jgi:hypothetical protein